MMYRITAVQMNPNTMKLWGGNDSRNTKTPVRKVRVGATNWIKPRVERGSSFALLANKYSGMVVTTPQNRSIHKVTTGNPVR
jgi:hypothetical protein